MFLVMAKQEFAIGKSKKDILKVAIRTTKAIFKAGPWPFIAVMFAITVVSILPFAKNYIYKEMIDEIVEIIGVGVPSDFTRSLITIVVLYLGIEVVLMLFWELVAYLERDQNYRLQRYFTMEFVTKSSTLDLYHYEDSKQNDLIQRAKESYSWRPSGFAAKLIWIMRAFVQVVTSISIIALFSPLFFVVIVLTSIPALISNVKASNIAWGVWDQKTETRRKFWGFQSFLTDEKSLMELRIFKSRKFILKELREIFRSFMDAEQKASRKAALLDSSANFVARLGTLSFAVYLIYLILQGDLTIGSFSFYTAAVWTLSDALGTLFRRSARAYEDLKYLADYYDFLDLENKIESGKKQFTKEERKTPPEIRFAHVDFTYPGATKPVLDNFELTIKQGERIAFVGENGAGKTTIIKLLSRFYDPTSGQIQIDGVDMKDINLDDWYRRVGILFQEFNNYKMLDPKTNIALGDPTRLGDLDAVIDASKRAGAHEFIQDLDKKYDQILSKRFPEGTDLSGGQWQRIALGRGFFRDAPILVLDEPTSAIDAKGEAEIFERLYEFSEGKTVIIISHRFSTVRMADKIYVIDKGKIIESGTHDELMELDGKYKVAFSAQAEGYK
jgi:ATP-binding cassette subfamily B protein